MTDFSGVLVVDFEQVNAGYGLKIIALQIIIFLLFVLSLLPGRIFEEPPQCSKDVILSQNYLLFINYLVHYLSVLLTNRTSGVIIKYKKVIIIIIIIIIPGMKSAKDNKTNFSQNLLI